jgi:hypothetical protein
MSTAMRVVPIIDSLVSRAVDRVARAEGARDMRCEAPHGFCSSAPLGPLTDDERTILETAPLYLSRGIALKRWFEQAERTRAFDSYFELTRTVNRPETSYGFFARVPLAGGGEMPVIGNVQEMFYDQPRAPSDHRRADAHWMRDQLREFVLRYFMRVSSFRRPEAFTGDAAPEHRNPLSWCPRPEEQRGGFGYHQIFHRRRGAAGAARFSEEDQYRIVTLTEIGPVYEWVLAQVRIYDFIFTFRPFGDAGPTVGLDLREGSHIILSPEFVVCRDDPAPGVLGEYGFGYAFIRTPRRGVLAFGPGEFDAAFQTFSFRVLETGEVQVRMVFIANRPTGVVVLQIDPVSWGFKLADLASFGLTSRMLGPVRSALEAIPMTRAGFDPVYAYVSALNALTLGYAGREWCVSRTQLEKEFLIRHFMQHYQTMVGSLLTWRQIPDWLDTPRLPRWVVTGRSG